MNIAMSNTTPLAALKWAFIGILIIMFSVTAYVANRVYDTNQKLNKTIALQKESIADLKHDLALIKIGQEAMSLGRLLAEGKKDTLTVKQREIKETLRDKEIEIDKTISDPEDRIRAKSVARMNSVWEMFCQLRPDNAVCQTKTFDGVGK